MEPPTKPSMSKAQELTLIILPIVTLIIVLLYYNKEISKRDREIATLNELNSLLTKQLESTEEKLRLLGEDKNLKLPDIP